MEDDTTAKYMLAQKKGRDAHYEVNKIIAELREWAEHEGSNREHSVFFGILLFDMSKEQLIETIHHLMGTAKILKKKLDDNEIKLIK